MPKELVLPSGKIAIIEKGKGKDLLLVVGKAKEVPPKQEEKMEVVTPITETITALASQTAKA